MHIALWIVQVLLALAFLGAGAMKLFTPYEALVAQGIDLPELLLRFIGLCEVLGAIGLVVPAATRIKPRLTPTAAALLALVMILALFKHAFAAEFSALGGPLVLGALSVFVAWGRFKRAPIAPRGELHAVSA